jgi:predicted alpha/beta hydrolase
VSLAAPPRAVSVLARDGRALAGLLLESAQPRGALVVNPATGFKREFYLKFAAYCAARGWHTLVYDYRGIGHSALAPLRDERACMSDWGKLDMPGALDLLAGHYPHLPLATLGHSVGGQLIGCMDNHARAAAHVMVATSTGYWGRQTPPFRYQALFLWKVYGPWQLRRHGYLPRGGLWSGEPLPPQVFRQFRAWCLSAAPFGAPLDAALSGAHFEAVRAPILALAFRDDPIATPAAVAALLAAYPNARIEQRWIHPREAGVRGIGHHGFFAERHRDSLWRGALDWLETRAA